MLTNFITKTFYYMTYSSFPCRLIFKRPVSFSEIYSQMESDQIKYFNRKRDGKRMKLHEKPGKSTEVGIKIGIMTKREDVLVVKRRVILSVIVRTNIKYKELLKKAVKKHH